jgi:hypothetical protein
MPTLAELEGTGDREGRQTSKNEPIKTGNFDGEWGSLAFPAIAASHARSERPQREEEEIDHESPQQFVLVEPETWS